MNKKKILIVMPALPYNQKGAEQLDRDEGVRQLIRLGYDVKVIAKLNEWQTPEYVAEAAKGYGVPVIGIPYRYSNKVLSRKDKFYKFMKRFQNPLYFDGAAFEYAEPVIQAAVLKEANEWKPDIMWFEYTYLWPLYHIALKRNIPIITRSINFEPDHFIEEDGFTLKNRLKYIPKWIGERRTLRWSNVTLSITPQEEKLYAKLGAPKVINVPLRGLPLFLPTVQAIRDRRPLKVFFMGSTYTVHHNKEALRTVIAEVAPKLFEIDPEGFKFYVLGKKLPAEFNVYVKDNIEYVGFVDTLKFLPDMDIAIIPSLFGAGMQQKIFEPLTMGIPQLTSKRGIADYPFVEGESVMYGKDAADFVKQLVMLKDQKLRQKLSNNSKAIARRIFSREAIDKAVQEAIEVALQ
jgi:glycosyltransferase involved in cell wall biosynthesis